ncbi:MAG: 3-hydroxyacyl-CoA dehydrogenase family protein [Mycobacterium sp.]
MGAAPTGFIGNRLQGALFREALSLVQNGIASAKMSISSSRTVSAGAMQSPVHSRFGS